MSFAQRVQPTQGSLLTPDGKQRSAFAEDTVRTTDVPEGIYVWTVDPRFGDIRPAEYDTIPHLFQNENFTEGSTGRYNTTGNLGSPRISRLFSDQGANMQTNPFLFRLPYDYFVRPFGALRFTNTKSPFTNLSYHSCGNKTNGEDRLKANFAVNAGKRLGFGFTTDYLYGRGYYEGQSTAHFDGTVYASYRGEQYQLHAELGHIQLKNRENGGIESDDYITRPESFPTSYGTADIPVNLARAWNKLTTNRAFLTHRYSLGFRRFRDAMGRPISADSVAAMAAEKQRRAAEAEAALTAKDSTATKADAKGAQPRIPRGVSDLADKESEEVQDSTRILSEFVPVTSFIHTLALNDDARRFQSHERNNVDNPGYFADFYLPGDSASDKTAHLGVENTFAVQLHEGLNKWMKMGLRLYAKHAFDRYEFLLPSSAASTTQTEWKEHTVTLGAQLLKQQGRILRYDVLGEYLTTGKEWGAFNVEGNARLLIPMRKDSLILSVGGFFRRERPSFYYRHYRGRNAWWDNNDLNHQLRTRVEATLNFRKTYLTASLENIQNYTYMEELLTPYETSTGATAYRHGVGVSQSSANVQLLALTLRQDLKFGIFHFDAELTYQATTRSSVYPLPAFTAWANPYLKFRIARVLLTEIGADVRYFTKYAAPAYAPIIGQYVVQDAANRVEVGNYPVINAYANFHLKRTRFYVMASHVNYKSGTGNPFLAPHYPMNRLTFRLGLSWNFVN